MKKLIIIPAYNESASIENTVRDIQTKAPDFDYVVINDCSTDNTLEICKENNFNYVSLPINLGIGGAVQTGYMYAQKPVYIYVEVTDNHNGTLNKTVTYHTIDTTKSTGVHRWILF